MLIRLLCTSEARVVSGSLQTCILMSVGPYLHLLRENVSKLGQNWGSIVGKNELNLPFKFFAIAGSHFHCRHQTEEAPAPPPAVTCHSPGQSQQHSFTPFVLTFRCIRSAPGEPVHLSCCAKGCGLKSLHQDFC